MAERLYEEPSVTSLEIQGSVLLSIVRHTTEQYPSLWLGLLLGFEKDDGVVDITHAFPFPYPDQHEGGSIKSRSGNKFQQEVLEAVRSLGAGVEFQGYFQSTLSGNFVTAHLVEALAQQQLTHKNTFVIVHNLAAAGKQTNIRALRLSKNFLEAHIDGKWKTADLEKHSLSFSNIFDEIPIAVHNQHLENLYLALTPLPSGEDKASRLNFSSNANVSTKLLESLYSQIDAYNFDQTNFNFLQRQFQKERSKIVQWKQSRKAENAELAKQGKKELDEDEWQSHFKLPARPSRLNNTLHLRAINELADDILLQCDEELIKSVAIERKLSA